MHSGLVGTLHSLHMNEASSPYQEIDAAREVHALELQHTPVVTTSKHACLEHHTSSGVPNAMG